MRSPSFVVAVTAIALGSANAAISQEMLNPPTALQEVQVPARILIEPSAKPATDLQLVPDQVTGESPAQLVSPAMAGVVDTDVKQATTVLAATESSRFMDAAVGGEIESPADSLNGTLAADAKSMTAKCPLKTEMLAFTPDQVAQATTGGACPRPPIVEPLLLPEPYEAEASPALSIYIPVGYGLDGWSVWGSGGFQAGVREDTGSVGAGGVGVGLGDAKKYVGLELGYTFVDSDDFGEGGFSGKLHRRVGDNASIAFGWNGFANIGRNDFEHSIYGVGTYIFKLTRSLDSAFSRLALTVGGGNGQFRSNVDRDQFENGANIFGNLALRVIRPVSLIAEWTGQDLAVGLSIAPFKNFPFVITPAVRDVTGSGYEPRFVLGAGVSFKF